nr:hypothetical protein Iba_chr06bCG14270 [Ipomoea batatas]
MSYWWRSTQTLVFILELGEQATVRTREVAVNKQVMSKEGQMVSLYSVQDFSTTCQVDGPLCSPYLTTTETQYALILNKRRLVVGGSAADGGLPLPLSIARHPTVPSSPPSASNPNRSPTTPSVLPQHTMPPPPPLIPTSASNPQDIGYLLSHDEFQHLWESFTTEVSVQPNHHHFNLGYQCSQHRIIYTSTVVTVDATAVGNTTTTTTSHSSPAVNIDAADANPSTVASPRHQAYC